MNRFSTRYILPFLMLGALSACIFHAGCKKQEEPDLNTPPLAVICFNPATGTPVTVFTFDASTCTDAQDAAAVLTVRWDFNGDGNWDTPYDAVKTATHQYTQAGTYRVKLEVKDSEGLTDLADTLLTVMDPPPVNTPPVAAFTISPSMGTVATVFTLDASISYDAQDSSHILQVRWDFDNDGTWDTPFTMVKTATQQFTQSGTHTIRLEVKDSGGLTSIAQKAMQVHDLGTNTPPVAVFTVNPTSQPEYSLFYFNAGGCYDNEDPTSLLQVRWDWENDGIWDSGFEQYKNKTHAYTQAGTYTVRMEVKDTGGLTDDTTLTITATPLPNGVPCPDVPTITYGGQTYNTVKIGSQCWFKENLNVGVMIADYSPQTNNGIFEKYCLPSSGNDYPPHLPIGSDSTCDLVGGLYTWHEAMGYTTVEGAQGICPPGWHIPTDDDWKLLEGTVDSQYGVGDPIWNNLNERGFDAGGHLKWSGITYWHPPNSCGTNSSGFSAIGVLVSAIPPSWTGIIPTPVPFPFDAANTSFWSSTIYEGAIYRMLGYSACGIYRRTNPPEYASFIRCLRDN